MKNVQGSRARYKKYKAKVKIDEAALEREIEQLPQMFFDVADVMAQVQIRRDKVKDLREAKLLKIVHSLRITYIEAGQKVSEARLKEEADTYEAIKNLQKRYRDWQSEYLKWVELKAAIQQKSFALRMLVELQVTNEFHNPSMKQKRR